eukprot:870318-Pyramimonas_sp.AAC.1
MKNLSPCACSVQVQGDQERDSRAGNEEPICQPVRAVHTRRRAHPGATPTSPLPPLFLMHLQFVTWLAPSTPCKMRSAARRVCDPSRPG